MKKPKRSLQSWVDAQRARGRSSFTKAEAEQAYGVGAALAKALHRLLRARWVAKPKAGFYIILDPPYRAAGSLPPEWYVDALMRHLGLPYYVGALSAAAFHGATHQAVQELQVVVPGDRKGLRPIRCGRARIRFLLKTAFRAAGTQEAKAPTGSYKVATPETTAWDLVFLRNSLGGLDAVGTALKELAEQVDPHRLAALAKASRDDLTLRRLGWLLGAVGAKKQAAALKPLVDKAASWRLLAPAAGAGRSRKLDKTWRLEINQHLDLDT